ncbi:MAG TPA: hypothetical protein VGG10_01970 [Rhizomicrobium sp.]|jgi:hypothetical protein
MSDIQNAPDSRRTLLNRVLLGLVILLGVLIVAAFLALVYGGVTAFGKHARPQPAEAAPSLEKFPPGAKILDMKVDNSGHTIVRLQTPQGQEIDTYDTESGKRISRIAPQP